ncbi:hypothetical protein GCM10028796_44420 [Ramlibacter monticola]
MHCTRVRNAGPGSTMVAAARPKLMPRKNGASVRAGPASGEAGSGKPAFTGTVVGSKTFTGIPLP